MATMKRRLLVTLEPEIDLVLRRLSVVRGRPQSALVRELLDAARPGLERAAELLEEAAAADPRAALAAMATVARGEIENASQGMLVLPAQKRVVRRSKPVAKRSEGRVKKPPRRR